MNGFERGPSPSLLAAEIVTLMMVNWEQEEEGTSIGHPPASSQEAKQTVESKEVPPIRLEP